MNAEPGKRKFKGAKERGRVIQEAGYKRRHQIERDSEGVALCRWCQLRVPKHRRTFCSDECVREHRLRSDVDFLRAEVLVRDRGMCAICGRDCLQLLKLVRDRSQWPEDTAIKHLLSLNFSRWRSEKAVVSGMALWDTDHIIPVAEGGGGCSFDLVRTLCVPCHIRETKQLRHWLSIGVPWNQMSIFDHAREMNDGKDETRNAESRKEEAHEEAKDPSADGANNRFR